MSLDDFIAKYSGQPLLYAPSPAREYLRGQCVQLVCYYVVMVWGKPVIWADAYQWFASNAQSDQYTRVANNHNDPNQIPPRGAVIVWGPNTPGSGGAGHIAIVIDARPGASTFVSFDQNWGGKKAHLVTHNWSNVVGWLLPKNTAAPTVQGGDEMIQNEAQAHQAYQLLRPNGDGSPDEIASTAGKRTWAEFANDARNEISARNQNLANQAQQLAAMQTTINQLNEAVTKAQSDDQLDKQKVAELTAQLTEAHDKLKDLQTKTTLPTAYPLKPPTPPEPQLKENWMTRFIAAWLNRKKK